jgi:predicted protein tyrosine phosphatase
MFELKISNLRDAIKLSLNWATHTVSLLDPDIDSEFIKLPRAGKEGQLRRYYFHDVFLHSVSSSFLKTTKPPTLPQIQDILEFTAPLKSTDKLLVHCHAGISRSTAVACGVLCQHGLTPNEAVKSVLSIRKLALPNKQVLTLFDEILGLEGNLVMAGTKALTKLACDNMPD